MWLGSIGERIERIDESGPTRTPCAHGPKGLAPRAGGTVRQEVDSMCWCEARSDEYHEEVDGVGKGCSEAGALLSSLPEPTPPNEHR